MLHIPHASRYDVVAPGAQMSVQIMLDVLHGPCPKPDAAQRHQEVIDALANPLQTRFSPQSQMLHKGVTETFTLLRSLCRQDCIPKRPHTTHFAKTHGCAKASKRHSRSCESFANKISSKNQMLHTGTDKTYIHALASPLQTRLSPKRPQPTLPQLVAAQRRQRDINALALATTPQTRCHPQSQMLHQGASKIFTLFASILQTRLSPQTATTHSAITGGCTKPRTRHSRSCKHSQAATAHSATTRGCAKAPTRHPRSCEPSADKTSSPKPKAAQRKARGPSADKISSPKPDAAQKR